MSRTTAKQQLVRDKKNWEEICMEGKTKKREI
jgi:hypothetical protein